MAGPFDYPQAQMYPPTVQPPRRLPPSPYGGKPAGFGSSTSVAGSGLPPIYNGGGGRMGGPMPPTQQPPSVGPSMPPAPNSTPRPVISPNGGQYVDMGYGNSGIYQNGMELYRPPTVSVDPGPGFEGGPTPAPGRTPGFEGGPTVQGGKSYGGDPRYWMRGRS